MPRFYFDYREDSAFVSDEEGEDHSNLDAAERAACEAAAELGRNKLPSGETRKVIIEVRNEGKHRVLTATISLEVNRVDPAP